MSRRLSAAADKLCIAIFKLHYLPRLLERAVP